MTLLLPLAVGAMTLTGCVADPAPEMVSALAGIHSATVTWQPPLGIPFPITAYVVTPLVNGVPQTPTRFNSTATTETVTGLTNGTSYTFEVKAINTLGNDSASSAASTAVTPFDITAVTTAGEHTCALTGSRTVYCWGQGGGGQLGNGTTFDASTPGAVTGIATATAIATGSYHTCALLADGTIKCWGENASGQLGDGTTTTSTTPVTVAGITTATAIAAGDQHTCALLADGSVKCWGYDGFGQLGDGTFTTASTVPVTVTGAGYTATAISAGQDHTCAMDFGVRCWGQNLYGQLGFSNGYMSSDTPEPPVQIDNGLRTATAIAAGYTHTCAVTDNHGVFCWGDNSWGQFGDGTNTSSINAVETAGISTATAIAAGDDDSCAVVAAGVKCWGRNDFGELGNGTTTLSSTPVTVVWP